MCIYVLCMCAFMHLRPENSPERKQNKCGIPTHRCAQICCSLCHRILVRACTHPFTLHCSRQRVHIRSNDMSELTTRSDAQSPKGEETAAAAASDVHYFKQSQLCSRRLLMGANVSWRAGLWTQSIINIISLIASRQVAKHGLAISRWGKFILNVMQFY